MQRVRIALLILIVVLLSIFTTGCWNYREVDKLSIVTGIAVDKGVNEQYEMTVEIIQISAGKDTNMKSKTLSAEGKTLFDAARNIIAISGKKLYWAHTKAIILSKDIASDGVSKVIEWYNRDVETREDVHILISQGESAKEIFSGQQTTESILSFTLDEILDNQVSLSKAPLIDILSFDIESQTKGISPVTPAIRLKQTGEKKIPEIIGTAIIKQDKLIGFLDGEETKDLLFIRNEIKGGILVEEIQVADEPTFVALEIFKSKSEVTPLVEDNMIMINLAIETTVTIGEISGTGDFMGEEGVKKLKQNAESMLKARVESLIKKVQTEYGADIFRFGATLWEDNAQAFKGVSDHWDTVFKDIKVNVSTKVNIKNSAILSEPVGMVNN